MAETHGRWLFGESFLVMAAAWGMLQAQSVCDPPFSGPSAAYATHGSAIYVITADFNGDGIADLAVANESTDDFSILLGTGADGIGDGGFEAAVHYPAHDKPASLAAADFNGDGILDVAVANDTSGDISVHLGSGAGGIWDGSFAAPSFLAAHTRPTGIVAADFENDGIVDLAVCNQTSDDVTVFLGNGSDGVGDGTFQAGVNYPVHGHSQSMISGDFDGDGNVDLAASNYDRNDVTILLGNGDGTFAAAGNYATGEWPGNFSSADLDGDGVTDLALSNWSASAVSILLGNGDGTFAAPVTYSADTNARAVAIADFNGDGILDLAVPNGGADNVSILLGNGSAGIGDGTFGTALPVPANSNPVDIVTADFNGDGVPDLAVANYASSQVTVFLNATPPVAAPELSPDAGTFTCASAVEINCATPGAVIRYTMDGRDPTEEDPAVISGSTITVNDNVTLKTRAWKDCWFLSPVASGVYEFTTTAVARELTADFNLVAVPVEPLGGAWDSWADVFGGIVPDAVWAWDPVSKGCVGLDAPGDGEPAIGSGYWVHVPSSGTASIEGLLPVAPVDVDLLGEAGGRWNLVGNPSTTAVAWNPDSILVTSGDDTRTLAEAKLAGWIQDFAWFWDGTRYLPVCGVGTYAVGEPVTSLAPAMACWIRAFRDCRLVLSGE